MTHVLIYLSAFSCYHSSSASSTSSKDGSLATAPASYRLFQERALLRDIKESVCMVPQPPTEDGAAWDVDIDGAAVLYELPDGTKIKGEASLVKLPGKTVSILCMCDGIYGWFLYVQKSLHYPQLFT